MRGRVWGFGALVAAAGVALGGAHAALGEGTGSTLDGGLLAVLVGSQAGRLEVLEHRRADVGDDDGLGAVGLDEVDDGAMALLVGVSLGTASTKASELSAATSTNAKYGVRPKCEQRGAVMPSSVSAVMQIRMIGPLSRFAHDVSAEFEYSPETQESPRPYDLRLSVRAMVRRTGFEPVTF